MENVALNLALETASTTMLTRIDNRDYPTDRRTILPRLRRSRQVTIVRLNHAHRLPDLVQALVANGCRPLVLGPHSCAVAHPHPLDDAEAELEISFFVRAWALQYPGVAAELTPCEN
jgi:hypothetical protein